MKTSIGSLANAYQICKERNSRALLTHFFNTFPRKSIGTRPWFFVKDFQKYEGKGWVDEEMGWGVIIEEKK